MRSALGDDLFKSKGQQKISVLILVALESGTNSHRIIYEEFKSRHVVGLCRNSLGVLF